VTSDYSFFIFAELPCYIEPIDRGERFEDPLSAQLSAANQGEVTGGGTQMSAEGGILGVGIDISLSNLDDAVALTIKILNELGAPKGSTLTFERDGKEQKISFGRTEGIVLSLDVSLPEELWNAHAQDVLPSLEELIKQEDLGAIFGSKAFEDRTDIYIYGNSAEKTISKISKWQAKFPLGRNSKVRKLTTDNLS
jgi:hypothetical protein